MSRMQSPLANIHFTIPDVANGFLSGYRSTLSYVKATQTPPSLGGWAKLSWKVARTSFKALQLAGAFPQVKHTSLAIKACAVSFIIFSGQTVYFNRHHHDQEGGLLNIHARSQWDIGCVKVWEMTPEIFFITNLALMVISLFVKPAAALVGFGLMAITALDHKNVFPLSLSGVLSGLSHPMTCIAFYAGTPFKRLLIASDLAVRYLT